jgi:hypothetical protein
VNKRTLLVFPLIFSIKKVIHQWSRFFKKFKNDFDYYSICHKSNQWWSQQQYAIFSYCYTAWNNLSTFPNSYKDINQTIFKILIRYIIFQIASLSDALHIIVYSTQQTKVIHLETFIKMVDFQFNLLISIEGYLNRNSKQ